MRAVTIIHLGVPSPTPSCGLPESSAGHAYKDSYLALLQAGFTMPRSVTSRAVRSYRTLSALPASEDT